VKYDGISRRHENNHLYFIKSIESNQNLIEKNAPQADEKERRQKIQISYYNKNAQTLHIKIKMKNSHSHYIAHMKHTSDHLLAGHSMNLGVRWRRHETLPKLVARLQLVAGTHRLGFTTGRTNGALLARATTLGHDQVAIQAASGIDRWFVRIRNNRPRNRDGTVVTK